MKLLFFIPVLFCNCLVAMAQDSLPLKISLPNNVTIDTSKNKCVVTVDMDGKIYFKGKSIKEKQLSSALQKDKCEIVVLHVNRDLVYGKIVNILSILEKGKYRIILETSEK